MPETTSDKATQLIFQSSIGRQKPRTLSLASESKGSCPFCDLTQLPAILKQDGDILLVPNKYPILKDSTPYVLIETSQCDSELSLYSENHLFRVFQMALETWFEMTANPQYASVLFLKNHGPFSGGSIRHPHMQLIGLHYVDYKPNIAHLDFEGPSIWEKPGVCLNISGWPRIGFTEFNIKLTDRSQWQEMCRLIQKTIHYILNHFMNGRANSYNFFFYLLDEIVYCKIMPRFVTTPLFVGYSIPQVSDNLLSIVEDIQRLYF
jgi:ATP adenylyltransferase/5',5'''-P-1,P-4-tetraphosphate phosphorylase II